MGQLALGLRSLAVRIAVFVAMAALLAWILGGTLFPSPQHVNFPAWSFAGGQWNWRVTGSSTDPGPIHWTLFEHDRHGRAVERRLGVDGLWVRVAGPRIDGSSMLLGIVTDGSKAEAGVPAWWMVRVDTAPERSITRTSFPDEASFRAALDHHGGPLPD